MIIYGVYGRTPLAIYRVQICFQGLGGGADDRYCNTFHIDAPIDYDWDAGDPSNGSQVLGMFINDSTGFYRLWKDYQSTESWRTGSTFKIYSLADAEPRTPVYSFTWPSYVPNLGEGAGIPLPAELAVCLSYEAVGVAGTNRARRRGRVYLGPLDSEAISTVTSGPEVTEGCRTAILTGWGNLVTNLATKDIGIGIYSPTDSLWLPAQHAWVDNAFDVQRRRGMTPYARSEWTRP